MSEEAEQSKDESLANSRESVNTFDDTKDVRPYLSILVFQRARAKPRKGTPRVAALDARAMLNRLLEALLQQNRFSRAERYEISTTAEVGYAATVLKIESTPAWLASSNTRWVDVGHCLMTLVESNGTYGVYASSKEVATAVEKLLQNAAFAKELGCSLISESVLEQAFLGEHPTRSLWLAGVHPRSSFKADSKVLSGMDVGGTLDPHGDHTYAFSAARSEWKYGNQTRIVGVTPGKARLWVGSTNSLEEFYKTVHALLQQLQNKSGREPAFPFLARRAKKLSEASGAFDISFETITGEPPAKWLKLDDETRERREAWFERGIFEIVNLSAKTPKFKIAAQLDGEHKGHFRLEIEQGKSEGKLALNCLGQDKRGALSEEDFGVVRSFVEDGLGKVRFSSGHTVVGKDLYLQEFSDREYKGWKNRDFNGFDVKTEKPYGIPHCVEPKDCKKTPNVCTPDNPCGARNRSFLPSLIGHDSNGSGKSLFTWVVENWNTGLLICDDGGGEIADFVHLSFDANDNTPRKLTLIHVKGANSRDAGRRVSTSAFEIVVGQAMKNLKYLDAKLLQVRLGNRNDHLPGWENGSLTSGVREKLGREANNTRAALELEVAIVQPHVRESTRVEVLKDPEKETYKQLAQLNTLLLEAEAACRRLNAEFSVYSSH